MEYCSSDPPQLKIGRSVFIQGLDKNGWQARFGNFIPVPWVSPGSGVGSHAGGRKNRVRKGTYG